MPDISDEIRIFEEAVLGEDVRQGFISLALKLNEVVDNIDESVFAAYGNISQSDASELYDSKIVNVVNQGAYTLTHNYWEDAPDNAKTWAMLVFDYADNYVMQVLLGPVGLTETGDEIYWRVVHKSTHAVVPSGDDWHDPTGKDKNFVRRSDSAWTSASIADDYDGKISHIVTPGAYLLSNSVPWTDRPGTGTWALSVIHYVDNYIMQVAYRINPTYPQTKWRIIKVSDFSVYCDWRNGAALMPVAGKKISIMGDSISTYSNSGGWVAGADDYICQGNVTYYPRDDVNDPQRTWWFFAAEELSATILQNNSWSGRAVTTVRDGDSLHDVSFRGSAAYLQAQIDKLKTATETPDIIIVKMGINDFDHEAPLGDFDGTTAIPEDTAANVAKFSEAYGIMLSRIMKTYKTAQVYCCTCNVCERNGGLGFPEANDNGDLLSDWNDRIRTIARNMGAKIIDHAICGITYFNLSEYTQDWDATTQRGLHPNMAGMRLIGYDTVKVLG